MTAFPVGNWEGFFLHLVAAVLFAVVGLVMVSRPVVSAESVTYLMSAFFLFGGRYQFVAAARTPVPGWGWHACNGATLSRLHAESPHERGVRTSRICRTQFLVAVRQVALYNCTNRRIASLANEDLGIRS